MWPKLSPFVYSLAIKVVFTIQLLTLWPHSKWRHEYYHDDYVVLDSVYRAFAIGRVPSRMHVILKFFTDLTGKVPTARMAQYKTLLACVAALNAKKMNLILIIILSALLGSSRPSVNGECRRYV